MQIALCAIHAVRQHSSLPDRILLEAHISYSPVVHPTQHKTYREMIVLIQSIGTMDRTNASFEHQLSFTNY